MIGMQIDIVGYDMAVRCESPAIGHLTLALSPHAARRSVSVRAEAPAAPPKKEVGPKRGRQVSLLHLVSSPRDHRDELSRRKFQVKILRPESYWFNQVGKVVSVDQVRLLPTPLLSQASYIGRHA